MFRTNRASHPVWIVLLSITTAQALLATPMRFIEPPDDAVQDSVEGARDWARAHAIRLSTADPAAQLSELQQLDAHLRTPRIIGLGEGTHGTREFFQMKHRLFRHLVENHGVRLFGLESSFAACLPIDRYIQTGVGDPKTAIKGQGFWTWDTEEVLALVEWMREWNANRPAQTPPLRFYGFDTQDAHTPLSFVLSELEAVAPDAHARFSTHFAVALTEQYSAALREATTEELDALLQHIRDLRTLLPQWTQSLPNNRATLVTLALTQAEAAIRIRRAERDQWSSLGRTAELALYARIRERRASLVNWLTDQQGPWRSPLEDLIACTEDWRCHNRFRDELDADQRQVWRDAVRSAQELTEAEDQKAALQDLESYLRVSTERLQHPRVVPNVRDETMAEFVGRLLDAHGAQSRIALWAHDWHISKFAGDPEEDWPRMGTFLEKTYGSDYLPVGFSFGSGAFQARYAPTADEDPSRLVLRAFNVDQGREDSFSRVFDLVDAPISVYAFPSKSSSLPAWWLQPHDYRSIGAVFQPALANSTSYHENIVLPEHFEVVIHVRRTTRARPLSPTPLFRFGARIASDAVGSQKETEQQNASIRGALVVSVSEGSLAERCGLQSGDRIIQLGPTPIISKHAFQVALAAIQRPGDLPLSVLRPKQVGDNDWTEQSLVLKVPTWIAEQ